MKKYVVVTGASSGIGKEICLKLKTAGFSPIALGRREDLLKEVSSDFLTIDISSKDSLKKAKSYFQGFELGSIVGLINNAGIYIPQSFSENEMSTWEKQFETNLFGSIRITTAALEHLKVSKGSILNISSTLGIRPIENTSAYSASKAAMNNWTLSLALELSKDGINVNSLCPGIVETPIHEFNNTKDKDLRKQLNSMQPLGRIGNVADIAPLAIHLINKEVSGWTTGGVFNVDGGILLKS